MIYLNEKILFLGFGIFAIMIFVIFAVSVVVSQDKLINMINDRCYIEPNQAFYEKKLITPSWKLAMLNNTVTIE